MGVFRGAYCCITVLIFWIGSHACLCVASMRMPRGVACREKERECVPPLLVAYVFLAVDASDTRLPWLTCC